MAVRRLASDDVQPKSFQFSNETEAFAREQVAKFPEGRQMSAVIPLLWRVQKDCGGWLPQKAMEAVAERLAMPYIRVLEVATFYTMFNLEPVGRYFVQLCGTTPCALRGANDLKKRLEARIGDQRHVTADGMFSWLEVECLGACCNAPMVQINDDYFEDLTPEILERLLDDLAAGREVKPGPQQGRVSSEPEGDVKTLQDPALFDGSMIGAWRKRFEEEAIRKAEADAAAKTAAPADSPKQEPKPAAPPAEALKAGRPDAGRAIDRPVADAPAQRAAAGEKPIDPADRAGAADPGKRTVSKDEVVQEGEKAPRQRVSYVAHPVDPSEGRTSPSAPAAEEEPKGIVDQPAGGTPGTPGPEGTTRRPGGLDDPDAKS